MDDVAGRGQLAQALHDKLNDGRWSAIFFEQQLVHLARLVILHADPRPPDDFNSGAVYDEWVTCVITVNDQLDADLTVEDRDERLAWEIRQAQLNHHAEQLPATAIHQELYGSLWPEMQPEDANAVEHAFESKTGMSIRDFLMVGNAVMARFVNFGTSGDGAPMIDPSVYFSSTALDGSDAERSGSTAAR